MPCHTADISFITFRLSLFASHYAITLMPADYFAAPLAT
jgi:hypothetical protein